MTSTQGLKKLLRDFAQEGRQCIKQRVPTFSLRNLFHLKQNVEMFKPKIKFENSGDFRGKHLRGGCYIYECNTLNLRPAS